MPAISYTKTSLVRHFTVRLICVVIDRPGCDIVKT